MDKVLKPKVEKFWNLGILEDKIKMVVQFFDLTFYINFFTEDCEIINIINGTS